MNNHVQVISSDIDGADLRRKSRGRHTRCDGKEDNEQIQDAIDSIGKSVFFMPSETWEQIFGRKN